MFYGACAIFRRAVAASVLTVLTGAAFAQEAPVQVLPDIETFVDIDNETIALSDSGAVEVDVWKFRQAVAAREDEVAADIYAGDLLPACYDDWILEQRDQLRLEVHRVFVRLAQTASERDDYQSVIARAQRIIDLEPTDEAAVRISRQQSAELEKLQRLLHGQCQRLAQAIVSGDMKTLRAFVGPAPETGETAGAGS